MSSKKSLYKPASEQLEQAATSSLPQGDEAQSRIKPKIKQGVLETSKRVNRTRPLSSTTKSSANPTPRRKPLVVCHNPSTVHSQLKAVTSESSDVAKDTVSTTKVVVLPAKKENTKNESLQQTKQSSKKGRFGQSRYKQAAAEAGIKNLSNLSSMRKSKINTSKNSSVASLKTPLPLKAVHGKTSTPASTRSEVLNWNESAIEMKSHTSSTTFAEEESASQSSLPCYAKPDSDTLEILTARYYQSLLLNATVKQGMREKGKQLSSELPFLHNKRANMATEVAALEKEIDYLKHECKLEAQINEQKADLASVADKLHDAMEQLGVLTDNIDAVRHSLPLSGIKEPDQQEMEQALDETRHLLGQINILTNTQAPAIQNMADSASALSQHCLKEASSVPLTKELLKNGISQALSIASSVSFLGK